MWEKSFIGSVWTKRISIPAVVAGHLFSVQCLLLGGTWLIIKDIPSCTSIMNRNLTLVYTSTVSLFNCLVCFLFGFILELQTKNFWQTHSSISQEFYIFKCLPPCNFSVKISSSFTIFFFLFYTNIYELLLFMLTLKKCFCFNGCPTLLIYS